MENIIKQIKKGAKHTRMSLVEKAEMKSALLRHVKANPVSIGVIGVYERSIPSPFHINNFRNKKSISLLVIGGLLMGGSVSFAAEGAVPGDVLFPVKVHVNEPVLGAIAVTPKAKAEWEVQLVARRLEEVEKLAVVPNVSPLVQRTAEQNLASYTHNVENRIAKFEKDDDSEDALGTASNLSEVLSAHEQVLSGLNTNASVIAVVQSVTTSTGAIIATTTTVSDVPAMNNESIKDALNAVRGARDNAEKKHRELKDRYQQAELNANSNKIPENVPAPSVSTRTSITREREKSPKIVAPSIIHADVSNDKVKSDRQEEIRSSINAQTISTPRTTDVRIESKNKEDKPRVEMHTETQRVDSND